MSEQKVVYFQVSASSDLPAYKIATKLMSLMAEAHVGVTWIAGMKDPEPKIRKLTQERNEALRVLCEAERRNPSLFVELVEEGFATPGRIIKSTGQLGQ